ncbi:MAG TPA: tetratricopeptide repeat protein [Chitinophagaceae bacterium]|nr:tetratricopeptide repeat protein [Chitinophagaceae bacterium]
MKKPQWITLAVAGILTLVIFKFARITPEYKPALATDNQQHSADDGHDHGPAASDFSIDTLLLQAKKSLSPNQLIWINNLENSITRGDVKNQQLSVYHQLSHFWKDSARIFEPYAWYEAEGARLENSEKSLTFAARLFLDELQNDQLDNRRMWKALQAKDLFERSLKINPDNDSAKVGLGACYLFGNITSNPMEGIAKIREVVQKDSTNIYAQLTLVKGSMLSGQFDKAISRLETVIKLQPDNWESHLLMADLFERKQEFKNAIQWYEKSLAFIQQPEVKAAVRQRIEDLKKEDK